MFKLKIKSRKFKGGGDTTTSSTIPEWAVPYLKNVGSAAEANYSTGQLDNVAGTNPLLQAASRSGANAIADSSNSGLSTLADQQQRLTGLATSGGFDTGALKDAAITQAGMRTAALGSDYGQRGTLGSGRQAVQQGAQDAATAATFAQIDQNAAQQNFQNKMTAEQGLGQNVGGAMSTSVGASQALSNLGAQQRGIEQENVDSPWQSLQRYASTIYGNPARQQTVASGGGK